MEAIAFKTCAYCGSPSGKDQYCCEGCRTLSQGFRDFSKGSSEFLFLDQANFKSMYRFIGSDCDYQLYVEGMHCSSCIHLIEKLPHYDKSITAARVDFGQSKLFLKVNENFSLSRAVQLLSAMGYKSYFLKPSDENDLNLQKENKALLKKIAVAGACAGNIMLFVIPVYSGLDGNWRTIFNGLSFLLFLPIVFYSGTTFYKSAWAGLKHRIINIDFPITLALLSGFILSTVNLVRGSGHIYYDSTASFIFLILCSRYVLRRIQQKYILSQNLSLSQRHQNFSRLSPAGEEVVSGDDFCEGDIIKVYANQVLPIDGLVESESIYADVSVLNGEPVPRKFEKGMEILAGSKIISDAVLLRVKEIRRHSHLSKLIDQLQSGVWKKSKFVSLTDRCAQVLILSVFSIAILTFLALYDSDPQEAFNRSLALIVLACPCALALGSPLAVALAVKKSYEKGILIKNTDAFEKVLKLKNIFFDKTGTLTGTQLVLTSSVPESLSEKIKQIFVSLEQKSYHPIAFAIREAFPSTKSIPVSDLREIMGKGVCGFIDNHFYECSSDNSYFDSSVISLSLKEDGHTISTLQFENPIRPESRETIANLQKRGMNCFIVSGDLQTRVNDVALVSRLPLGFAHGGMSSIQKQDLIRKYKNTCMIGDGTNDALALQAADVGIAVAGSTLINLQAADVFFTRSSLSSLLELFELAQKAKKVLVRNLIFSLAYNFVGGALAIAGLINPMLAAILMPISSLIILASTLWGLK